MSELGRNIVTILSELRRNIAVISRISFIMSEFCRCIAAASARVGPYRKLFR